LLLQCYHLGYEVGRYISLERLIEQNKERYYETLEQSSQRWHEGIHDLWPYVNFLLFILKSAYAELVDRVGDIKAPRGSKTEMNSRGPRTASPRIYRRAVGKGMPGREPGNGAPRARQSKRQAREMHRPRARCSLDQDRLKQERVMSVKRVIKRVAT
jgi:hypothetical protein